MDSYAGIPIALLVLGAGIFFLILLVLWIVLPFALFGTKPLLRELIAEQRRTNQLLEQRLPAIRRTSADDLPSMVARRDD